MKILLSSITAIVLGLGVSSLAQTTSDQQQQQQQQDQSAPQGKRTEQNTEQPAGPVMGHSDREQMKDTSQPAKMKTGGTTSAKATTQGGAAVQTTTVFRNGRETSEHLALHRGTRERNDTHFAIGTHPRDWWLHTYSIVLISGCHYYLADNGCWYPAYGFDPSCSFPEGVVYCD